MASPTALPIARLRAAGCRVSTVIGHDPNIGDWIYRVTLPSGIVIDGDDPPVTVGAAQFEGVRDGGRSLIAKACAYRIGRKTPEADKRNHLADIAETLSLLACEVEAEVRK